MSPCHEVDRRGIEPRSPACKAGIFPLDEQPDSYVKRGIAIFIPQSALRNLHSKVTEVGVEPTKSPRSQRDRFTGLRTRAQSKIYSSRGHGSRTREARLMRPGGAAGSPAIVGFRCLVFGFRTAMLPSEHRTLKTENHFQVTKGRVELPCPRWARRSERRVSTVAPLRRCLTPRLRRRG